jgi:hypothetical protein
MTYYFTIWSKAIPITHVNEKVVIPFLEQNIMMRFGVPSNLVFDNATYFSSTLLTEFSLDKGIIMRKSTNYYPWGNGVAESTNKNPVRILKKTIIENHWNWHNAHQNSLWVDRVTHKEALGNYPYFLVYGKKFILPTSLYLPSLQLSQSSRG